MFKSKYKWNIINQDEWMVHSALIQILLNNRGITANETEVFLKGEEALHSPFRFNDMEKAVQRIQAAIDNEESIVIYGDYDVDGVTGTSILYLALEQLGALVEYYIPNRFSEGYGPNLEAFKSFAAHGIDLIITVDNGISGIDECDYLKDQNLDIIITDHHEPKDVIPCAHAIIHPKLENEAYPFKDLSGCGVAFKLAWALLGQCPTHLLDLAALGTLADVVSVRGENRSILKMGMKQLKQTKHLGLRMLSQIANITEVSEFSLGFMYGPRLNAPGRMVSAHDAVQLLISRDADEVVELAHTIEALNEERKAVIDRIMVEAHQLIKDENLDDYRVLVLAKEGWHEGVLGIVASRLVEHYRKPAIVLASCEDGFKGSARTLPGFHLFDSLNQLSHLLERFGGHEMAAGLTIKPENVLPLREGCHKLCQDNLQAVLQVDSLIKVNAITPKLIHELEQFRPFGPGNQQPLFLLKEVRVVELSQIGRGGKHLRLTIEQDDIKLGCIAFNLGYLVNEIALDDTIDLVGQLEFNTFNQKTTVQLQVKDIRCPQFQLFDYRNRYIHPKLLEELDIQLVYFNNPYQYENAVRFDEVIDFKEKVFLIDLPDDLEALQLLMEVSISQLYVLFRSDDALSMEHLMTREKMGKIYAIYRAFKQFQIDDKRVLNELKRHGFDKNIHNLSIQVFFELNFVIIENNEVIIVPQPGKKDLQESPTYRHLLDTIKMKEILTFSITTELKQFLLNL
jgi:single-stranded-DNA-specific exonuclease